MCLNPSASHHDGTDVVHLVCVAGHAIYQHGCWYGGFPGEERFYEQHIQAGLDLYQALPSSALILTGGHTRPALEAVQRGAVTNSEAEGMLEYLKDNLEGSNISTVLVENFARDSFENCFFSLLCFYHHFGRWPQSISWVSWPFKALRFYLIACGLGLGDRCIFRGSGDLTSQHVLETVAVANTIYDATMVSVQGPTHEIIDPLHRGQEFQAKRLGRMDRTTYAEESDYMQAVQQAYNWRVGSGEPLPVVDHVLQIVAATLPGGAWRQMAWPWRQ